MFPNPSYEEKTRKWLKENGVMLPDNESLFRVNVYCGERCGEICYPENFSNVPIKGIFCNLLSLKKYEKTEDIFHFN